MRPNITCRLSLVILLVFVSASCGFTPVYAPGSKTNAALSDIVVAPPKNDRANYIFVKELEDRIGRNLNAGKVLKHDIWVSEVDPGLESSAPRTQLLGKVTYQVASLDDGRALFGGTVGNFVAYSPLSDITTAASNDAEERLMTILADQMVTELIARFSSLADE